MKDIIVLIIILLMSGQAISQPSRKDSSVIANKDLRKAAIIIEQSKVIQKELQQQQDKNDLLQHHIRMKDSVIFEQEKNIWIEKINSSELEGKIEDYKDSLLDKDKKIIGVETMLHKQRKKINVLALIAAVLVAVVLVK